MSLIVNCSDRSVTYSGQVCPCRIGRAGFIDGALGREGDEKTPLGTYHLRFGFYRADRLPMPPSPLNFWPLEPDDGWCDAPTDPAYNRFVKLPYPASTESLWRDDGAYDIILVMDHNDHPPQPGLGSAVFLHIAQPDDRQTMGCIALSPDNMAALLPHLRAGLTIEITA